MSKLVTIELTSEQAEKLRPLKEDLARFNTGDTPASIIAQPLISEWRTSGKLSATIRLKVLTPDETLAVQKALDVQQKYL